MLGPIFACVLGSVPSPGRAILDDLRDASLQLVAQGSEQGEAEKSLEEDMKRAKERTSSAPTAEPETEAAPKPTIKQGRKYDKWPEGLVRPTFEGQPRDYYWGYGVFQWVAAAVSWGYGLRFALFSALAFVAADDPQSYDRTYAPWPLSQQGLSEGELRAMGWVGAGLAVTGAIVGAVFAFHANDNLEISDQLRAEEHRMIDAHLAEPPAPAAQPKTPPGDSEYSL
jgi:hypothetical protein